MMRDRSISLSPPLHPFLGVAFLNFFFLFLLMIIFFSFFATPSGFEIKIPNVTRDGLEENHATIRVTSENVLYLNDKVVTINELKRALPKIGSTNAVIYLRADRRASMGRISDVWDLCRGLGTAKIKVVALQDN